MKMRIPALLLAAAVLAAPSHSLEGQSSSGSTVGASSSVRNAFVRDQTILGLVVYAPSFAVMVGDDALTGTAAYLVMAGGTFFGAAEVARRMNITEAQQLLSARMAWRTALGGLYVATTADGRKDDATVAAATLLGGLGGTTAGILIGNGLTSGEAMATVFGHDLAFTTALAFTYAFDSDSGDGGLNRQSRAIAQVASGWVGYAVGRLYAGNAPYNITPGDVTTLWIGSAIGATAVGAILVETDATDRTAAVVSMGGAIAGAWLADRALVRRIDLTRSEANLMALGATAGGLMGMGVGVLASGSAERGEGLTIGLAAAGASAGLWLTQRYLEPRRDAGRSFGLGGLSFNPSGVAFALTGAPGNHSILSYTF